MERRDDDHGNLLKYFRTEYAAKHRKGTSASAELTQAELGKRLGITGAAVSALEKNISVPSATHLAKILRYLEETFGASEARCYARAVKRERVRRQLVEEVKDWLRNRKDDFEEGVRVPGASTLLLKREEKTFLIIERGFWGLEGDENYDAQLADCASTIIGTQDVREADVPVQYRSRYVRGAAALRMREEVYSIAAALDPVPERSLQAKGRVGIGGKVDFAPLMSAIEYLAEKSHTPTRSLGVVLELIHAPRHELQIVDLIASPDATDYAHNLPGVRHPLIGDAELVVGRPMPMLGLGVERDLGGRQFTLDYVLGRRAALLFTLDALGRPCPSARDAAWLISVYHPNPEVLSSLFSASEDTRAVEGALVTWLAEPTRAFVDLNRSLRDPVAASRDFELPCPSPKVVASWPADEPGVALAPEEIEKMLRLGVAAFALQKASSSTGRPDFIVADALSISAAQRRASRGQMHYEVLLGPESREYVDVLYAAARRGGAQILSSASGGPRIPTSLPNSDCDEVHVDLGGVEVEGRHGRFDGGHPPRLALVFGYRRFDESRGLDRSKHSAEQLGKHLSKALRYIFPPSRATPSKTRDAWRATVELDLVSGLLIGALEPDRRHGAPELHAAWLKSVLQASRSFLGESPDTADEPALDRLCRALVVAVRVHFDQTRPAYCAAWWLSEGYPLAASEGGHAVQLAEGLADAEQDVQDRLRVFLMSGRTIAALRELVVYSSADDSESVEFRFDPKTGEVLHAEDYKIGVLPLPAVVEQAGNLVIEIKRSPATVTLRLNGPRGPLATYHFRRRPTWAEPLAILPGDPLHYLLASGGSSGPIDKWSVRKRSGRTLRDRSSRLWVHYRAAFHRGGLLTSYFRERFVRSLDGNKSARDELSTMVFPEEPEVSAEALFELATALLTPPDPTDEASVDAAPPIRVKGIKRLFQRARLRLILREQERGSDEVWVAQAFAAHDVLRSVVSMVESRQINRLPYQAETRQLDAWLDSVCATALGTLDS